MLMLFFGSYFPHFPQYTINQVRNIMENGNLVTCMVKEHVDLRMEMSMQEVRQHFGGFFVPLFSLMLVDLIPPPSSILCFPSNSVQEKGRGGVSYSSVLYHPIAENSSRSGSKAILGKKISFLSVIVLWYLSNLLERQRQLEYGHCCCTLYYYYCC